MRSHRKIRKKLVYCPGLRSQDAAGMHCQQGLIVRVSLLSIIGPITWCKACNLYEARIMNSVGDFLVWTIDSIGGMCECDCSFTG
jgi:hypothetical protein